MPSARRACTSSWSRPQANKIEIRRSVERIFNVKVVKVNTLNRPGKRKRNRQPADVRQAPRHQAGRCDPGSGQTIPLFETS